MDIVISSTNLAIEKKSISIEYIIEMFETDYRFDFRFGCDSQ